jgi:hypothetical protein
MTEEYKLAIDSLKKEIGDCAAYIAKLRVHQSLNIEKKMSDQKIEEAIEYQRKDIEYAWKTIELLESLLAKEDNGSEHD